MRTLPNDVVFTMIGARRPSASSGARASHSRRGSGGGGAASRLRCSSARGLPLEERQGDSPLGPLPPWLNPTRPLVGALEATGGTLGAALRDPATLLGTLRISASGASFFYTLAYSLIVLVFGIRRVRRRIRPTSPCRRGRSPPSRSCPSFSCPRSSCPGWGTTAGSTGRPEGSGRRALPRGGLRPRARVLASVRPRPRLAPQRLQLGSHPQPLWGWLASGSPRRSS